MSGVSIPFRRLKELGTHRAPGSTGDQAKDPSSPGFFSYSGQEAKEAHAIGRGTFLSFASTFLSLSQLPEFSAFRVLSFANLL